MNLSSQSPQGEGKGGLPASAPQMPTRIAIALCGMVAGPAGLLSLEALGGGWILL